MIDENRTSPGSYASGQSASSGSTTLMAPSKPIASKAGCQVKTPRLMASLKGSGTVGSRWYVIGTLGLQSSLRWCVSSLLSVQSSSFSSRRLCGNRSVSGAPDNSSLSHFLAMTRPTWLGRVARNRHRHAIEQASRRWRGGRRDDSGRTRRKILISAQV